MSNWIATNELRYIKRKFQSAMFEDVLMEGKVLQQKWETIAKRDPTKDYELLSEWRDVPVVEEE